jgi:nicotinamidase-related amidase
MTRVTLKILSGLVTAAVLGSAAMAADVVTDWASVTPPPAPKVEKASPDIATTALLMLDFNTPPCDPAKRPRCIATLPAAKALLDRARAKGMFVVYTLGGSTSADSINQMVKPLGGEPLLSSGPDKFIGTDMDKVLKDHGIKTVITMGTVSNGAILYTASGAAFRGFKVLVPIDGVSAETPYGEQITLWQLLNGPRLGGEAVKLTKTDMIDF